jgi:hypothetical protein
MDILGVDIKTRTILYNIDQFRKRRNSVQSDIGKSSVPDAQAANLRKRHPGKRPKAIRRAVHGAVMHDHEVAIRGCTYITLDQVHPKTQCITGSSDRVLGSALGASPVTGNQKPLGRLHHVNIITRRSQPYFGSLSLM